MRAEGSEKHSAGRMPAKALDWCQDEVENENEDDQDQD